MELHLNFSAAIWAVLCSILFSTVAIIAIFVCLKRLKLSHKLIGFFISVPLCVAITETIPVIAGSVLPLLEEYPVIGFLASASIGILTLGLTAAICGKRLYAKTGKILNYISTVFCFAANTYLTYSAWKFAAGTSFRGGNGIISISSVFPFLSDFGKNFGIEIIVIAILLIYIAVYFISFAHLKTPLEVNLDDITRRSLIPLAKKTIKHKRIKETEDESECKCCEYCEYAQRIESDPFKMLCRRKGVVESSHVCGKYIYDPLKRKAFRPHINPLSQSDTDFDGLI